MTKLDEAVIAQIKPLYEESDLTLVRIGVQFGCSATSISQLAKRRCWKLRAPRKLSPPKARTALALRLCDVINSKLDQMEKDMQSGELSSADLERDAKSMASMIGGMDKALSAQNEDKKRKPRTAAAAAVNEVERIHREIIERFERIQRRRNAQAGSE